MSDSLLVDTSALHHLALASSRARREVEHEAEALRHGARDGGRATQKHDLELQYESLFRRAVRLLGDLTDSLETFGRTLDRIAEGYTAADDLGLLEAGATLPGREGT